MNSRITRGPATSLGGFPIRQETAGHSGKTSVLSVLSLLESFALAIILAFIFRGFVVEAFVIPTGSMAESLMGLHSETICPNCRYEYPTGLPDQEEGPPQRYLGGIQLRCPNCGDRSVVLSQRTLPRAGDRVLVLKPMYFLSRYKGLEWLRPKRWDVVVFLYPGLRPLNADPYGPYIGGQDNYIKRLAGLPGETIEVIDGDVYIDGQIVRKPARVQDGLWINVLDNDYQPQPEDLDWPLWRESGRKVDSLQGGRLLTIKALGGERTITYQGSIVNTLGYNALRPTAIGDTTVGDLRLSFDLVTKGLGRKAKLSAVLSKRDRYFRMAVDLSGPSPVVELQSKYALEAVEGEAYWKTLDNSNGAPLRAELAPQGKERGLHLQFQNVDYRVSIWVDGKEILATTNSNYHPPAVEELRVLAKNPSPTPDVALSCADGDFDLLHIKLERDVYYTSPEHIAVPPGEQRRDPIASQMAGQPGHGVGKPFEIPPTDKNPSKAYFMLGDNSSDSMDSRLWWGQHSGLDDRYVRGAVPQSHMIGQAFFVYWPAAGPLLGNRLPLIPRVGKMRLIH